jgi:hypothetical protein
MKGCVWIWGSLIQQVFDDQPIYFRWIGDYPKEEWTKFGYRSEMKIDFSKLVLGYGYLHEFIV